MRLVTNSFVMIKFTRYFLLLYIFVSLNLYSQVGINNNGALPDPSAGLDINFTNKGLLLPRIALACANVASPVTSPAIGLEVYNTAYGCTAPNEVCPGLYVWNGHRWQRVDNGIPCGFEPIPDDCVPDGTVTDIDGNVYPTLIIGNLEWMATNLRVSRFRDGTAITYITDNAWWSTTISPAYCWYNNDYNTYGSAYGALYNGDASMDSRLCPDGWHVPIDGDWCSLITFLDAAAVCWPDGIMSTYAGGKLKETGTAHWQSPNAGATNEVCFSALPGGWRNGSNGNFSDIGSYGYWWSQYMPAPEYRSWYTVLNNNDSSVSHFNTMNYQRGFSVRCVRDY